MQVPETGCCRSNCGVHAYPKTESALLHPPSIFEVSLLCPPCRRQQPSSEASFWRAPQATTLAEFAAASLGLEPISQHQSLIRENTVATAPRLSQE